MSTIKNILINKDSTCQSIWFMRQAGRYLPEFRKIRSSNKNFINLCLNSDLSSEITLQPIKRYNLDAAIIFSDILMVPYALGQKVNFIKNYGPVLSEFNLENFLKTKEEDFSKTLQPVYNAITKTRLKLHKNKSLISFIGAPWTLIVYMLGLKDNKNKITPSKININRNLIEKILNNLNKFLCLHIENQIKAGSDIVQIFDSWAGLIPNEDMSNYCYSPNLRIVDFCKERRIPVICFPKGIKENYKKFNLIVKPNGLNLDYELDPAWAKNNLTDVVLQGGMHPKTLLKNEQEMYNDAKKYLDTFKDVPYIFNLGHGLVPETNPDQVLKLVEFIRNYK